MAERFHFSNLREILAKANEQKSGDELAGIAARSERERVAAKCALADVALADIVAQPLVDDDVTALIHDTLDQEGFRSLQSLTVGEFREFLLHQRTTPEQLQQLRWAITPEIAAAAAKIMSNRDLVTAAARIRNPTHCRNTMGESGVLGVRIQPNHPTDDVAGILLATMDGLLYGCGDAVIGVNPVGDSVETVSSILHALQRLISAYDIPTQARCLAHISTQLAAMEAGAPVDLLFQSVREARRPIAALEFRWRCWRRVARACSSTTASARSRGWGSNVMYFETGQGSALSAEAHHGIDQVTLEARAYSVARAYDPFLVNSVVGFIGPEYLADERQIIRAGLEDHFMGKLLGLPMGCDVCYTNHAQADQNSADNLMLLLAAAGCNYFMGVPCGDDVMLGYQSTSYHDAAGCERCSVCGRRRSSPLGWSASGSIAMTGWRPTMSACAGC